VNADIIDTMKQINRSLAALLIAMACLFTFPSFIHAQAEAPGQVESGSKDQMDPKSLRRIHPE